MVSFNGLAVGLIKWIFHPKWSERISCIKPPVFCTGKQQSTDSSELKFRAALVLSILHIKSARGSLIFLGVPVLPEVKSVKLSSPLTQESIILSTKLLSLKSEEYVTLMAVKFWLFSVKSIYLSTRKIY